MLKGKKALITGATAGIGRAVAMALAREGAGVIISGRRSDRLKQLKEQIEQQFSAEVYPLTLDVRDKEGVHKAIATLPSSWQDIDILINNAGLALGMDKLQDGSPENWDVMIDTNIKGLLYVTHEILPIMLKKGRGDIVNIGSIAGHEAYPGGNVYCATKHAVNALTKGLRMDVVDTGIRVSSVDPGLVETEFSIVRFHGDREKAQKVYQGLTPLRGEDIAEILVFIVSRPPHVQIADVVVFPTSQASALVVHRD